MSIAIDSGRGEEAVCERGGGAKKQQARDAIAYLVLSEPVMLLAKDGPAQKICLGPSPTPVGSCIPHYAAGSGIGLRV